MQAKKQRCIATQNFPERYNSQQLLPKIFTFRKCPTHKAMLAINSTFQINQRNKLKKFLFQQAFEILMDIQNCVEDLTTQKSNFNFERIRDSIETLSWPWYATPYRSDLSICGRQSGGKMAAGAKRGLGSLCNLTAIPLTRKEEGKCYQFQKWTQKCVIGVAFGGACLSPRLHFHR